ADAPALRARGVAQALTYRWQYAALYRRGPRAARVHPESGARPGREHRRHRNRAADARTHGRDEPADAELCGVRAHRDADANATADRAGRNWRDCAAAKNRGAKIELPRRALALRAADFWIGDSTLSRLPSPIRRIPSPPTADMLIPACCTSF